MPKWITENVQEYLVDLIFWHVIKGDVYAMSWADSVIRQHTIQKIRRIVYWRIFWLVLEMQNQYTVPQKEKLIYFWNIREMGKNPKMDVTMEERQWWKENGNYEASLIKFNAPWGTVSQHATVFSSVNSSFRSKDGKAFCFCTYIVILPNAMVV